MAASPACQHGALWTATTHTWTHQHLLTQTEFHSTVMPLHTLAQTHTFVALGRFRGRTSASTINWNILLVREVERLVSFFCPENKYFRCWTNSMSAWDGLYSSVCVSVCVCVWDGMWMFTCFQSTTVPEGCRRNELLLLFCCSLFFSVD